MKTEKTKEYALEFTTSISTEAPNYDEALWLGYNKICDYFADNGFDYDRVVVKELLREGVGQAKEFGGNL